MVSRCAFVFLACALVVLMKAESANALDLYVDAQLLGRRRWCCESVRVRR